MVNCDQWCLSINARGQLEQLLCGVATYTWLMILVPFWCNWGVLFAAVMLAVKPQAALQQVAKHVHKPCMGDKVL